MNRIKKRCKRCGSITTNQDGFCDDCHAYINKFNAKQETRVSSTERGYTSKWRTFSKDFLSKPEHQICEYCRTNKATLTEHVIPAPIYKELYGDNFLPQFFKASCNSCNIKKGKHQDKETLENWNNFKQSQYSK